APCIVRASGPGTPPLTPRTTPPTTPTMGPPGRGPLWASADSFLIFHHPGTGASAGRLGGDHLIFSSLPPPALIGNTLSWPPRALVVTRRVSPSSRESTTGRACAASGSSL